jgi:hypothetical protein
VKTTPIIAINNNVIAQFNILASSDFIGGLHAWMHTLRYGVRCVPKNGSRVSKKKEDCGHKHRWGDASRHATIAPPVPASHTKTLTNCS